MSAQLAFRVDKSNWIRIKDAHPTARSIFVRHYSYRPYRDGRRPLKFVGPGEYIALVTPEADALFVWRRFISGDGQRGVNCAVFRNESPKKGGNTQRSASRRKSQLNAVNSHTPQSETK